MAHLTDRLSLHTHHTHSTKHTHTHIFLPNIPASLVSFFAQVGFHDPKQVRKMAAPRKAEAVNRLARTKEERPTNLAAEHEAWEKGERSKKRAEEQVRRV